MTPVMLRPQDVLILLERVAIADRGEGWNRNSLAGTDARRARASHPAHHRHRRNDLNTSLALDAFLR
jgi:hypothetical protein